MTTKDKEPQETHTVVPVVWNDDRLILAAGGNPRDIQKLLFEAKQPIPSDMAVYQWVSRGVVPNVWRPKVLYALLRTNRIQFADIFTLAN